MNQNRTRTFLFTLTFLFAANQIIVAQKIGFDSPIEKIANIEKKAFANASGNSRVANGFRDEGTVASVNFDVNYYRCEWEIDPNIRSIKGKVTSYFTITAASDKIVYDLSDTLTVDSIIYHGNQIAFQKNGNDGLQLQFPAILNNGEKDSVSIFYHGVPRDLPEYKPFVQYTHNGAPMIYTLSEPYGAKEWWPCKNGLSDKADSVDIIITNPVAYQASSNGVMSSESIINTQKQSVWKHRYPIASYLVAMAVTNFSVLKDTLMIAGKPMELIDYSFPEYTGVFNTQRIYVKQALTLFSKLFGDYPFVKEKYGFTQFGASGGMEHQTNTFLSNPSISLIEHETGHQWFGDKITCGSWQDIWLNEGFATYCQVLFNQYIDTTNYYPILKNMTHDLTVVPNGSVWVNDTTNPERIFSTKLSYYKGAYLLHMLRWELGDDVFFRGMKKYFNDPLLQYSFARTADFKRNMEQESGRDLTVFFQKWFYGEGFPSYSCTWMQNKNNWAFVQINQTTSDPSVAFYDMPVQLRFMNALRDTLITVSHEQNGETFWVNPGFIADSMAVDPYYWILAKNRVTQKIPPASFKENDIKIYPNPAPDNLNISILNPTVSKINLQLYNATGQLVYKIEKSPGGRDEHITIPVSRLARGIYVLCISSDKNIQIRKLITR